MSSESRSDAQLAFLLALILLMLALRWISYAGVPGRVAGPAACWDQCRAFGGIQVAYTDADGAHCICRHP